MIVIVAVLLILALYLFLIFPTIRKHPDRELLKGLRIAHRGLHDIKKGIPENSISAHIEAVKKGYAIENDIHITADGEVVVFHDDTLKRVCGVDLKIEELTLSEIKKFSLLGTDEKIPTLKEVLDVVDGKVPLLIEFKSLSKKTSDRLCPAANKILSEYKGKYFIQSFYPFVVGWHKKNRKDILRGQLSGGFYKESLVKRLLGQMLFNFIARPDFVSYEWETRTAFARRLNTLFGALPVGWTFHAQEQITLCQKDFEAFIFEDFEAVKQEKPPF